jgi:hypothetical protein
MSIAADGTRISSFDETTPIRSSTVSFSTEKNVYSKRQSLSMYALNRSVSKKCANEKLKGTLSVGTGRSSTPSRLHPIYHSQRSLHGSKKEQIWIKRRLSNNAIEKVFDRRKPFVWKEIVDVTV